MEIKPRFAFSVVVGKNILNCFNILSKNCKPLMYVVKSFFYHCIECYPYQALGLWECLTPVNSAVLKVQGSQAGFALWRCAEDLFR